MMTLMETAPKARDPEGYHDEIDGSLGSDDSGGFADSDSAESTTRHTGDTHKTDSSSDDLGRAGASQVRSSKILVLFVLAMTAVGVGYGTFLRTSDSEDQEFQQAFENYAYELTQLIQAESKAIYTSMQDFANTMTSYAVDEDSEWPYVTVPHFEVRGDTANELTSSVVVAFSPIVPLLEREAWEEYATKNQDWIREGLDVHPERHEYATSVEGWELQNITYPIWRYGPDNTVLPDLSRGPYLPVWQVATAPHDPTVINYNLLSNPVFEQVFHWMEATDQPILSPVTDLTFLFEGSLHYDPHPSHPHSFLMYPVHQSFDTALDSEMEENTIVAAVTSVLNWDVLFSELMPQEAKGLIIVVDNNCGDVFSYRVNGPEASFLGLGNVYSHVGDNKHVSTFDGMVKTAELVTFLERNSTNTSNTCDYILNIYPSIELRNAYLTADPALYTAVVVMVFFLTTLVFVFYDFFVQQRNEEVVAKAKRSNAIVSALFPKNVRDRIMKEAEEQVEAEMAHGRGRRNRFAAPKSQLKSFLSDGQKEQEAPTAAEQNPGGVISFAGKPIADLFPSATVMFADIAGFTAWSSVREPAQVFQLLETLYNAFDEIAGRRRVFKVETIGDCYVAVAGLPEPRKDHAVVISRFARDCIQKMNDLTKLLEVSLGPDTADLALRVGAHSGPVTAGVLRGEKARFQLFGDTVNTASRMESNGTRNKIHVSSSTADELEKAGKGHWLVTREDKVVAKGKGEMTTFWLEIKMQSGNSATSRSSAASEDKVMDKIETITKCNTIKEKLHRDTAPEARQKLSPKAHRLVKWNVEIMIRLLKQVVSRRNETAKRAKSDGHHRGSQEFQVLPSKERDATVIDEVKEIIELPEFDAKAVRDQQDPSTVRLDPKVETQLFDYIALIASMYRDVPFHNFEHASHVTMSVTKLLSRIVAPDEVIAAAEGEDDAGVHRNLHDHTFGITSDPLTQLAVIFSALIHDVDHTGVPNAQLVKEGSEIAKIYKNKSVAEQNSIDIAWELLMDPSFEALRHTIYTTGDEKRRFRQLLVNVVLATDIVDKELKELRNKRWDKAFHGQDSSSSTGTLSREEVNRKATIVLEHIIQASDISHTMQHWHVYRKWNERFFDENMKAYKEGRMEKNPSEFWYKGEIGFFDFYIIPLAKKLKECGVFGVSSDEYLNYAINNRREWELKGEAVVAEMLQKYET